MKRAPTNVPVILYGCLQNGEFSRTELDIVFVFLFSSKNPFYKKTQGTVLEIIR